MTKGAAALPLFACLAVVLIWQNRAAFRNRYFWVGVFGCLLVSGPWHLVMLDLYGKAFLAEYLGFQIISRTLRVVDDTRTNATAIFYLPVVWWGFFPLFLLVPFSVFGWLKRKSMPIVLPIFGLVVLALYSLASTKHPWYMVPLFPVLSIVAAPLRAKFLPLYLVALVAALFLSVTARPVKDTNSLAYLGRLASRDAGRLGFYPHLEYGPEILFYSNRVLCADAPEHSMGQLSQCDTLPQHVIMSRNDARTLSPAALVEIARAGEFAYYEVASSVALEH